MIGNVGFTALRYPTAIICDFLNLQSRRQAQVARGRGGAAWSPGIWAAWSPGIWELNLAFPHHLNCLFDEDT